MTGEQPAVVAADGVRPRRSTERGVACAIDLGWRVAALYATSLRGSDDDAHLDPDLLPNRARLLARDRVELELRAIAGDVARAGVELSEQDLARLLELGREAADSAEAEARFREELARRHVAFEIALWAEHEARGKAYEIGNFVSDTWNRVVRPRPSTSSESELLEVFSAQRVKRMKVLLDDLQTRIDPAAVHTVQTHLDSWHDRVHDSAGSSSSSTAAELTPDEIRAKYEPVERQTVIWRQLLTGDKEPEAFIDRDKRAEVRDELTREIRKRYQRWAWLLVPVAAIGALVGWLLVEGDAAATAAAAAVGSVAGALGLTRASMTAAIRKGLQSWGELMWNRSLAAVICRETSVLDELYPPAGGSAGRGRPAK